MLKLLFVLVAIFVGCSSPESDQSALSQADAETPMPSIEEDQRRELRAQITKSILGSLSQKPFFT